MKQGWSQVLSYSLYARTTLDWESPFPPPPPCGKDEDFFRGWGSGTVAWYQILIRWHHVNTTLLLNLLKKRSVNLEGIGDGSSHLSLLTVSPVNQPTGFFSVSRSLYFMMDMHFCHGICSSPKSPWVKDSFTQLSSVLLVLSQKPWIQTHTSTTPLLCQPGIRAPITCRNRRWKQSTSRCLLEGQKNQARNITLDTARVTSGREYQTKWKANRAGQCWALWTCSSWPCSEQVLALQFLEVPANLCISVIQELWTLFQQ